MIRQKILFLVALTALLAGCSSQKGRNEKNVEATFIGQTEKKVEDGVPQLAVKKYTLPNGLRILVAPNDKLPTFSFYIHYGVGAKHEIPGITGSSHFLEHMMFKGSLKVMVGSLMLIRQTMPQFTMKIFP